MQEAFTKTGGALVIFFAGMVVTKAIFYFEFFLSDTRNGTDKFTSKT
jgi:hypothetical protein